ncbi:MAG: type II toxin-antitoxin system Phd/YefM family antitoxin [Deltaproteobacteria bacterium]|nr:type II toxin-antitoxin system Phd/YefM family antitoxin [Deltaproteobacteria bacterium]
MPDVRFSEDIRTITDLKVRAAEIVDHVRRSHRPVLLTRRGNGVAVLLDLDEYERLVDRASFIEAVKTGAMAADAGDLHPNKEAMAILDSFGE